tara:strand:+ start:340 stop:648 length:309 start_codon:yes stop_codon:yes gene_type:complete
MKGGGLHRKIHLVSFREALDRTIKDETSFNMNDIILDTIRSHYKDVLSENSIMPPGVITQHIRGRAHKSALQQLVGNIMRRKPDWIATRLRGSNQYVRIDSK